MNIKETEELLKDYFVNLRTLNIYKNSITNNKESVKRLKECLNSFTGVCFSADIKSPVIQEFMPSNRQLPKGLDGAIGVEEALEIKYKQKIEILELDIFVTSEKVVDLVHKTQKITSAFELIDSDQQKVLLYKLNACQSFQTIADTMLKSKSAARAIYFKGLRNVASWLERL